MVLEYHDIKYLPPCLQGTSGVFLIMGPVFQSFQSWDCSFKGTQGSFPGALGSFLRDLWPLNFCYYFFIPQMAPKSR